MSVSCGAVASGTGESSINVNYEGPRNTGGYNPGGYGVVAGECRIYNGDIFSSHTVTHGIGCLSTVNISSTPDGDATATATATAKTRT